MWLLIKKLIFTEIYACSKPFVKNILIGKAHKKALLQLSEVVIPSQDTGAVFLKKVGTHLPDYTVSYPRQHNREDQ
jgi:hypothetical protein